MDMLREFNDITEEVVVPEISYNGQKRVSYVIDYMKALIEIDFNPNTLRNSLIALKSLQRQGLPESARPPTAAEAYFLQEKDRKPAFYGDEIVKCGYKLHEFSSKFGSYTGRIMAGEEIRLTMTILVTPPGYEGGKYDEAIFEKTGKKKFPRLIVEGMEKPSGEVMVPEGGYGFIVTKMNELFGIPEETEERGVGEGYNPIFLFDPLKKQVSIGYSVLELENDDLLQYLKSPDMTNERYDAALLGNDPYFNFYAINALNSIERNVFGNANSKGILQPVFGSVQQVEKSDSSLSEPRLESTESGLIIASAAGATPDKLEALARERDKKDKFVRGLIVK